MMAKKKAEKSLEELLEKALVKEDEQPYDVPRNWVWVKIGSINHRKSGNVDPRKFPSDKFELYSVPSFADSFPEILEGRKIKSSKQAIKEGDILLCKINPRINRVWMVGNNTEYRTIGSSEWIVITPSNEINNEYLLWVLRSNYFRNQLTSNVSGVGGSLTRAKPTNVALYPIPIPPLPEQKRIAKKLSSMLGKLKEARELIQEARDTFEERRAAILNKAFAGELTKKWREEDPDVEPASMLLKEMRGEKKTPIRKNRTKENMPHTDISYLPPLPTKWEWAIVGEISDKIHYGYTAKSEGDPIGPKLLRITDIQNDTVDWNIVPYCKIDENQKTKYFLREGDLVFARTGATVGKSYLLSGKFPESVFASYLIRIIINKRVSNRYISNFFKSPSYWQQITSGQVGIGQPNVNAQTLSRIILPLPPFSEQKEIVRILENLLDHEDEARALIDMEEQIDLIEKSILSKAFRGELGTNDPNDEPAIELLKKSLKEKMNE